MPYDVGDGLLDDAEGGEVDVLRQGAGLPDAVDGDADAGGLGDLGEPVEDGEARHLGEPGVLGGTGTGLA